ncbi:Ig-like V-type domain-containing protein FAM187A [Xenopus tropicalis]|uniref:Ig-like V-type domain-containing protein FAM187A n=1 Tax=Xenopus tropicalis TaxID=8364 RepID=A0A8J0QR48_XENTR|nr:Ig-like V-type domain-containing protein FAM187A [Xenopus tropicalis]|eukprot:XP_002935597.3 PREDICTED: Ig-like V-type domain-containing protein FAM187A [Xenopus tropicalis]
MKLFYIIFIFIWITFKTTASESDEKADSLKQNCPGILMFEQTAFLQDMSVELPCRCKPDKITAVIWFYKRHLNSKDVTLIKDSQDKVMVDDSSSKREADLYARFDVVDHDLLIVRSHPDDSGIYICGSKTGEFFYGYELDIQKNSDARVIFSDKEENPIPDFITDEFQAYTSLGKWSPCDRCGVRGEQTKIGLCYVNSKYINPRYQVKDTDVSCGSDAIPERFKPLIANRTAEIFVRSCEAPCDKNRTGILGKVVNAANNVAGYLKNRFGFLPIHKLPTQKHVSPLGGKVTITCPGSKPEDAVAWDKDKERLYRTEFLIGIRKYMNVFIDHGNNLHIKFAQFSDKGLYTCWLNGKRQASFELNVSKKPPVRRKLTDTESIFAIKVIGFCFLACTVLFFLICSIRCCCYCCKCCPLKFDPEAEV